MNYVEFKKALQANIAKLTNEYQTLYVTDVDRDSIWNAYMDAFPDDTNPIYKTRREYDCNCCKQFIRPYANIIALKDNTVISIWDIEWLTYPFNKVAENMSNFVKSKPIVNVFVSPLAKLGTDKSRVLEDDGSITIHEHYYVELPSNFVTKSTLSIEATQAMVRDAKNVFKRSMDELTTDAGKTLLELIEQGSLYRGEEFKKPITEFIGYKQQYDKLTDNEKDNWCWKHAINNPVAKIRNTAIGTLLIDLTEDVDLDIAVRKFEHVMTPTNYKRPTAIVTTRMIEEAEKKINELGYADSLARRFAVAEDITVNNVLFVNRDVKKKLSGSVFDEMKESIPTSSKKFNKVEEVSIETFITDILPKTSNLELMIEGKHQSNLMSLIAPQNLDAPSMLKWNNNFSWSYNGDITDSMKQHVKNAGGKVDGVLRFSIMWNDKTHNLNDFDAHCIEPSGNEIYFGNKVSTTGGNLDVDIIRPTTVAVENITWPNINTMKEGRYKFFVNNYCNRGGAGGFDAEIEFDGQIYSFSYDAELRQNQNVLVAEIEFSRTDGIKFITSLDSNLTSKEVWGINTNKFVKVSMAMFSPNYWNDQHGIGNKHYFFILNGCNNDGLPRGFFNEFLDEKLMEQKRVFEVLGSKMRVEASDNQLSGLGFSSTKRNSIIAKVDGAFSRTIKINF